MLIGITPTRWEGSIQDLEIDYLTNDYKIRITFFKAPCDSISSSRVHGFYSYGSSL